MRGGPDDIKMWFLCVTACALKGAFVFRCDGCFCLTAEGGLASLGCEGYGCIQYVVFAACIGFDAYVHAVHRLRVFCTGLTYQEEYDIRSRYTCFMSIIYF